MTFRRIGKIKNDALERKMEITPSDKPLIFLLPRLNYLLGFIVKKIPEQQKEFVSKLETIYFK
ncbi:MAG: hypothetical protein GF411_20360 [Candidatus Lokiarchaeota archaeon]|nr:hypothetical protein [Candidatus Lokiarchaeota archaeon]